MPLQKIVKHPLAYFIFRRKSPKDFLELRKALVGELADNKLKRDVAIDLTSEETVGDGEVMLFLNIAQGFAGKKRLLHIIAPAGLHKKFNAYHVGKFPAVKIHESREEFMKTLGAAAGLSPKDFSPPSAGIP